MNNYGFKLFFEGLCAVVERGHAVETYALYGHGDHSGTLAIRADFIDPSETTWQPKTVAAINEPDGNGGWTPRQIGIWTLHGEEVTVTDGTAVGAPTWRHKDRLIDFAVEHPGASTLPKGTIRKMESRVGIVNLIGQGSVLEPSQHSDHDRFAFKKRSALHNTRWCARCVTWTAAANHVPTISNRAGDAIVLREAVSGNLDAWACVSNVASVPHPAGLKHFHHFYEGVRLAEGDSHMSIENAVYTTWDCTPIIVWPPPPPVIR